MVRRPVASAGAVPPQLRRPHRLAAVARRVEVRQTLRQREAGAFNGLDDHPVLIDFDPDPLVDKKMGHARQGWRLANPKIGSPLLDVRNRLGRRGAPRCLSNAWTIGRSRRNANVSVANRAKCDGLAASPRKRFGGRAETPFAAR